MGWTLEPQEWIEPQEWTAPAEPTFTWVHEVRDGWPTNLSWHLSGFEDDTTWCGREFPEMVEVPTHGLGLGAKLCGRCRRHAARLMDMSPEERAAAFDRQLGQFLRR